MKLKGLQKLTLLDFKGCLAATVFTGGCNFTCPFCHNKDLVLYPNTVPDLSEEDVLEFLKSRIGRLEGLCITGGEPGLHKDLPDFIEKVKALGFKVKLDTNGTSPELLKELIENQLLDYIAMDIKNSYEKYNITIGQTNFPIEKIDRSISLIMQGCCDYEFRTTVVKELHTEQDILYISKRIQGAQAYFLQPYRDSDQVINPVYSSYALAELQQLLEIVKPYVNKCDIIGL